MANRDPLYDNARALLCLLVVVGHCLEPLLANSSEQTAHWARAFYQLLYSFHIPAFAALSGALSSERVQIRILSRSLLVPLLIFQILYVAFDVLALGHPWTPSMWVRPYWLLWFLFSLFIWRVVLPYWMRFATPVFWSAFFALIAGCLTWVGYPFALSRTFVFFPFFVGGHVYLRRILPAVRQTSGASAGALALFALAFVVLANRSLDLRLLYGSVGYREMGLTDSSGILFRMFQLLSGGALTLAFFCLAPATESVMGPIGQRAMSPYVWHGFVVRSAAAFGIYSQFQGPWLLPLAVSFGVALFFLLSSRFFALP